MKDRRIAIIGGGPGGLMVARVLQTRGVASTVFEGETSATDRSQGGTLDMHPETGQYALRMAGLEAGFHKVARPEDQGGRIYDSAGTLRFEEPDDPAHRDRPEVDREVLRRLLLESLDPGVVRWGHKLRAIQPCEDGTSELAFGNGEVGRYDFVVGADGSWSKVRPMVSAAVPSYSGVTFVELHFTDVDRRHPEIAQLVGRGKMFALGNNRGLIAQRNGNTRIFVYAALRVPEDWVISGGIDPTRPLEARVALAEWFPGWASELLALIHQAGDRIVFWKIHALPVGHRWENRPGVTLIGDAAHLMSPFGGDGANLAMRDAADLACALADTNDWEAAVQGFEAQMFDRAEDAAQGAASALDEVFADEGLEHALDQFQGHHQATR